MKDSDLQIMLEFRKRFGGSCLEIIEMSKLLNSVGMKNIKNYLDNLELKVIKKPKRK